MKFVSRNANLRIILKAGIPADALGHPSVPALSVKFEDGMVEVHDEKIIEMLMMPEKGFGVDYIISEVGQSDPFSRNLTEPEHDIMNVEYGRVAKNLNPKQQVALTPELKKAVEKMAFEYAKEMATKMAAEMVTNLVKEADKEAVKEKEETVEEKSSVLETNPELETKELPLSFSENAGTPVVASEEGDPTSVMPPPNKKVSKKGKK